jgi:hypothetical protein
VTIPNVSLSPRNDVENAVVARLGANWGRRAAVKKPEQQFDDLFDADKLDYPDGLIPFGRHPAYRALSEDRRHRIRARAWIAFNKNVMDVEQHVVNPGFALLARDVFDTGMGDTLAVAVTQAMVDEQYHTLMHLQASALTRRARGIDASDRDLPDPATVRRMRVDLAACDSDRDAHLTTLAYTTVAEISITSYLALIEDGPDIQPVNRATVALHERDEHCHASIAAEMALVVHRALSSRDRQFFHDRLDGAMDAFASNDMTTWARILELEGIDDGDRILADVSVDASRKPLLQDYSGIEELRRRCAEDLTR